MLVTLKERNDSRLSLRALVLSILALTSVLSMFPAAAGITWTSPQQVLMGSPLSSDSRMRFLDAAPAIMTALRADLKLKFVDANANNNWNPGESVVYDYSSNNQFEAIEPLIAGSQPSFQASLKSDTKVKLVDTNGNTVWDSGETVVYDSNVNNLYDSAEPVIAGKAPPLQGSLNSDDKIKYVDTNGNNAWNAGESVVYDTILNDHYNYTFDPQIRFVDANSNNARDAGETVTYDSNSNGAFDTGEPVIAGTTPAQGTILRSDLKVKFVDSNRNGLWASGEAVVYDTDGNGILDSGEAIIVGGTPALQSSLGTDLRIKYADSNSNNVWDPGESVVYETVVDNNYTASVDPKIRFVDRSPFNNIWDPSESVVYDNNNNRIYDLQDTVLAGGAPAQESDLINDPKMKLVDSNRNGIRDAGESIVYDTNSNGFFDSGETVISGAAPLIGTLLSEPVIAGPVPSLGTLLKTDGKVKMVDSSINGFWDPGEAVAYDVNNDGLFDSGDTLVSGASPPTGTLLKEPVVSGVTPSIGAPLKFDPKLKYIESGGASAWDPGEAVLYDADGDGLYDLAEPVLAGGAGSNGVFDVGEVVVYDTNSNGLYNHGEPTIAGSAPVNGSILAQDLRIKFLDDNGNSLWEVGETVVYDSNNNNGYDSGEPTISGTPPPVKFSTWPSVAEDSLGRVWLVWSEKDQGTAQNPDLFYRLWNGSAWLDKQQLTTDPSGDATGSVTALSNQTMMILWSSNSTGNPEIVYKLYSSGVAIPYPTTGIIQLTSNSLIDDAPSAVQDKHGRIWVAWTRHDALRTISDIYYRYFNGTAWSTEFVLPPASSSGLGERNPSIRQTKDGKIWTVWASNDTITESLLYYSSTDGNLDTLPTTGIPAASWATKTRLFNDSNDHDHPSFVQSRDGVLYIFFHISTNNGVTVNYGTCPTSVYASCISSGASWVGPSSLASGNLDQLPGAAQIISDKRIWAFFTRQFSGTGATDQIWLTKSDQITNIHDMGVRELAATPRFIKSGQSISITVTAYNKGDFAESTTLTLKLNNTVLTNIPLTLTIGEIRLIQYTYQTAFGFWGRYILSATLPVASGELSINQPDNLITGGLVRVSPPGDVDGNGTVNILDAAALAFAYNTRPGDPLWNPNADIDGNGHINILDAALLAFYYGKSV